MSAPGPRSQRGSRPPAPALPRTPGPWAAAPAPARPPALARHPALARSAAWTSLAVIIYIELSIYIEREGEKKREKL